MAAACIGAMLSPAAAAAFPAKPIEVVVPFPAGGSTDVTARMLAGHLSGPLGQPVIVVNRPGASGIIGATMVSRAPADGHTLLAETLSFVINGAARKSLSYSVLDSFTPIVELATIPLMVLVHPSLPVKSFKELVELAKAKPGTLNYASSGRGTAPHVAAEMLKERLGIDLEHIPFKGNSEASAALLSGEVPIHIGLLPPFIGHVRSGALRVLAVTTEKRIDVLPDTPTIAELGYPGIEISSWQGLFAPSGTPPAVVEKLNAETVRIFQDPAVRESIVKQGASPVGGTVEAFTRKVKSEFAKWKQVVDTAGIRLD